MEERYLDDKTVNGEEFMNENDAQFWIPISQVHIADLVM